METTYTLQWYCAGFIIDIGNQEPKSNEECTTPFWTTKENMIANSIFPEWYSWWFGLLGLKEALEWISTECGREAGLRADAALSESMQ